MVEAIQPSGNRTRVGLHVQNAHVKALLAMLDEHAKTFLTQDSAQEKICRIYFVDADVISVFVDGKTSYPLSTWASLLSLGARVDRGTKVDPSAESLANSVGQACARYLFGPFRRNAEIQRNRLFITREHEREFKSIIHSILKTEASLKHWPQVLMGHYLNIANAKTDDKTATSSVETIVDVLEKEGDAEGRAYTLLRDVTTPLGSHLFTPPADTGMRAFLWSHSGAEYQNMLAVARERVWRAFEKSLLKREPHLQNLLELKRFVFDEHDIIEGANKSVGFFRQRVRQWAENGGLSAQLLSRLDVDAQAKIAAREAADLSSIAQIESLGQWLNAYRPLPQVASGACWETVLISGSDKLADLHKILKESSKLTNSRLVHPLCLMRHVDMWDPAGTKRLGHAEYLDEPHEFALSLLLGAPDKSLSAENLPDFLESLEHQLKVVIAREAEYRDQGLKTLRAMLEAGGFNRDEYLEAVRDMLTRRFVRTYQRLAELFPLMQTELPASSLPALDLPSSDSAMRYLKEVRDALEANDHSQVQIQNLDNSLKEDTTGYSALLSASIGYMARGKAWVPAAQTMVATAVLLAKGRGENQQRYPEGNEALYIEAFLLRMTLNTTDDLDRYSKKHEDIIDEARKTLKEWARVDDRAQITLCEGKAQAVVRVDWIDFRYRLEGFAGKCFKPLCLMISSREPEIDLGVLAMLSKSGLALHFEGAPKASTWEFWPDVHQPSNWFCGIQTGMSLLQLWLCWRQALAARNSDEVSEFKAFETELSSVVNGWYPHRRSLGKLLPLLAVIYHKATGRASDWASERVDNRVFDVSFAAIDSVRLAWLKSIFDGLK